MRRGRHPAAIVLAVLLAGLMPPQTATAHAKLLRTDPKSGGVVRPAPKVVRLWFRLTGGEELHPQKSVVSVWDARGRRVDDGKGGVDLNDLDRLSMIARLKPLAPGTYTVRWQAISSEDLNVVRGSYKFTVAPPPKQSG